VPLGLPKACIDHTVPFHASMSSRWSAKLKLPTLPAAKHSTGDAQAMLLRSLGWVWFPSTGTCGVQRRPFQLSARIVSRCLLQARPPTEMQAVLLMHDTLASQENDRVAVALAGVPAARPVASTAAASAGPAALAAGSPFLIRRTIIGGPSVPTWRHGEVAMGTDETGGRFTHWDGTASHLQSHAIRLPAQPSAVPASRAYSPAHNRACRLSTASSGETQEYAAPRPQNPGTYPQDEAGVVTVIVTSSRDSGVAGQAGMEGCQPWSRWTVRPPH